ncbi:hypothetical protein CEXT_803391 [Caerostris extrusa]|uniref:Uncharacterized protein n=1 Tax=Caerostris extrusa TaxID=172846 RepID=A0AAV4T5I4_CAEEX|nr:hypothetical protein CEXT_803391 [Caerostris extrusa]
MNKRSVRQRQRMALKDRFPTSYKLPADWYHFTPSYVTTRTVSVGVDNRVAYATEEGAKKKKSRFWQEWLRHFSIARRHIAMVRRLRFKNISAVWRFFSVVSRITSRAGISIFWDGSPPPVEERKPRGEASLCLPNFNQNAAAWEW